MEQQILIDIILLCIKEDKIKITHLEQVNKKKAVVKNKKINIREK